MLEFYQYRFWIGRTVLIETGLFLIGERNKADNGVQCGHITPSITSDVHTNHVNYHPSSVNACTAQDWVFEAL